MSFGTAVRTCFGKYADFSGRASRSEFWWFYLFCVLVNLVFYIPFLALIVPVSSAQDPSGALVALTILLGVVWFAVVLALLIPQLAVGCRRLHDRGMSGWLQLLMLVPCGSIALVVLWILDGTPADNEYGPRLG